MSELCLTFQDKYITSFDVTTKSETETTPNAEYICDKYKVRFKPWKRFNNGWILNTLENNNQLP